MKNRYFTLAGLSGVRLSAFSLVHAILPLFLAVVVVLLAGLSSIVSAIGTWTWVDGGGATGINYDTGKSAWVSPTVAAFGGSLYVAWAEPNSASPAKCQIRVKKYTPGTGWSFVDGNGANGLNYSTSEDAFRPALVVFGGNLYLAWDERDTPRNNEKIQVRRYDGGSTWTAVDGGRSGLNHYPGTGDVVGGGYAQGVTLAVFNGALYAAWSEVESRSQIRVKRYDGGSSWTFVDHAHAGDPCPGVGINYSSSQNGHYPKLIEYGSHLYAVWNEDYEDSASKSRIRVKRYDGGSAWTFVSGANGLNYEPSDIAQVPSVAVLDGFLYVAWYEGNDFSTKPDVRVKRYNGTAWDDTFLPGRLDWGSNKFALFPTMIPNNHVLYFSWDEEHGTDYTWMQIRVKKYNGSSFTFIDGNGASGINYYSTKAKAEKPCLAVVGDTLYVVWAEPTEVAGGSGIPATVQIRVKKIDLPSATLAADAAMTESNLDARYVTLTLANTTFVDSTLSSSNFSLDSAPGGLMIESLSYVDSTHCRVYLQYDGRDIDTDVGNLGVTIAGAELADGDRLTASNVLSISATNDVEAISIADDGQILERAENGEVISVTLSGGQFAASLTPASWTVTNLPAGVSKGSVSRTGNTTVQIALSGNATIDYDADITNVTMTCPTTDYLDSTGEAALTASSGVRLQCITPPTVVTSDPPLALTDTTVTIGGDVTSGGKALVTARGIELKRDTDAVYTQWPAAAGGTGPYSVTIPGLTASTAYNARAYATNEDTAYGGVITFSTSPTALTLRNLSAHRTESWGAGLLFLVLVGLFGVTFVKFRK